MKSETALASLLLAMAVAAVWYCTRHMKGRSTASVQTDMVTDNAGGVVPEPSTSNSPAITGDEWGTPYYLRANYPVYRPSDQVIPSNILSYGAYAFGMQEIPPML